MVFTGNWESIFRATYWEAGDAEDWGRDCAYRYSAPFFFSYYIFANCVLGNLCREHPPGQVHRGDHRGFDQGTDLVEVVQIAHMLNVFRR